MASLAVGKYRTKDLALSFFFRYLFVSILMTFCVGIMFVLKALTFIIYSCFPFGSRQPIFELDRGSYQNAQICML
jgi:hypothetical protein